MADEYIKRDSALNTIHRFRGYIDEDMEWRMKFAINKIPSADVVEVVRCKDCKNNYVTTHNHGKQDDPRCDFTDRHLSLDDFCSRGERRMDGE